MPYRPLYNAQQIKEWDQFTIAHEPITSIGLMERAATKLAEALLLDLPFKKPETEFLIICGAGNNGGDGLALCRILLVNESNASYVMAFGANDLSEDARYSFERLKTLDIAPANIEYQNLDALDPAIVIIDALFGNGLNRPLGGEALNWISAINSLPNKVLSIDLPSGLPADMIENIGDYEAVKADFTMTFQNFKPSFMLPESGASIGIAKIINIGLHASFKPSSTLSTFNMTPSVAASLLRSRPEFSHKGTFGKCLIMAGSATYTGAALLSCQSALKSGVGLVALDAPGRVRFLTASNFPEVIYPENALDSPSDYDAICIGPGISTGTDAIEKVDIVLSMAPKKLVLDADALNIISSQNWKGRLPKGCVITPHPGEFARMFGVEVNRFKQLEATRKLAADYGIYILLKGKHSALGTPDGNLIFNTTGNSGLAKGGSGDVLTGLISGLMVQAFSPEHAAALGMFIHGYSADLAILKMKNSEESLLPSELCAYFGAAFKALKSQKYS